MVVREPSSVLLGKDPLSFSGYPRVSSEMLCLFTRVRLRHWWLLVPSYLRFRRVKRLSQGTPGLFRFAFAVQSPRTFHTVSLWRDEQAILLWDVHEHVETVRWTFRHAEEVWSAEWRLSALSPNRRWDGQEMAPDDLVLLSGGT